MPSVESSSDVLAKPVSLVRRLSAWCALLRLPNLLTVFGDPFVGYFLCGGLPDWRLVPIAATSVLIYAFGLMMNDFVDAQIDAQERPDRPIPSGLISRRAVLAAMVICIGLIIGCAVLVSVYFLLGALALTALTALYNRIKQHPFRGSVTMALCRVGNILLGALALPAISPDSPWIFIIFPLFSTFFYVYGISRLARDEMHCKPHVLGRIAILVGSVVPLSLFGYASSLDSFTVGSGTAQLILLILSVIVLLAGFRTFVVLAAPFLRPEMIQNQVKHLIAGMILLQAAWIVLSSPSAVWVSLGLIGLYLAFYLLALRWQST